LCNTKLSLEHVLAEVIIDLTNLTPRDILRVILHVEEESPLFRLDNWLSHGGGRAYQD
jgi:hypothetical protein